MPTEKESLTKSAKTPGFTTYLKTMIGVTVPIASDMILKTMEEFFDSESIKALSDDELQRLSNSAWYIEATELCWLCQDEFIRRSKINPPPGKPKKEGNKIPLRPTP